jgi:hypothetical protein
VVVLSERHSAAAAQKMSDAEEADQGAASPQEQSAKRHARDLHEELFGDDDDSDGEPAAAGQEGGDAEGDEDAALATARSLKAKQKSELKQRLQRLAQGKKAESGAWRGRAVQRHALAPRHRRLAAAMRHAAAAAALWVHARVAVPTLRHCVGPLWRVTSSPRRREKDEAQNQGRGRGRRASQKGRRQKAAQEQARSGGTRRGGARSRHHIGGRWAHR